MECLKRKWLKDMKTYMLPPKPKKVLARLHMNENPFPPPARVKEAAKRAVENGNLYPDPERLWKLRELAARYYKVPGPEWVLPTLGSDTALRLSFECCALESPIALPFPSFQAYPALAGAAGAKLNYFDLSIENDKFVLDVEKFKRVEGDLAVIDTPNNPTGSLLLNEDGLNELSKSFSAVLVDEAYAEFAPYALTEKVEEYGNVMFTRTMSKAFALAGFRIGFLISNPEYIENISKMVLPYDIPSATVEAAIAALEDPSYSKEYINYVENEKRKLRERIEGLGWKAFESYTNFVLVKAKEGVVDALREKGIMVRRVPLGKEWFRVSIGRPEEMELFYTAIEELAKSS